MTDTLVERLKNEARNAWERCDSVAAETCEQAASRIAELEADIRSNAEKDEALDIARKQIVKITCDATQKLREIGYECDPPERTYMPALDRISKALSHSREVVDEKPV